MGNFIFIQQVKPKNITANRLAIDKYIFKKLMRTIKGVGRQISKGRGGGGAVQRYKVQNREIVPKSTPPFYQWLVSRAQLGMHPGLTSRKRYIKSTA